MKRCIKCNIEKSLEDYYKHKQMADGHLNKCKVCTKLDSIENYNNKIQDEAFLESERVRGREKYSRLNKNWKKPSKEQKKQYIDTYKKNFPEKYHAHIATSSILRHNGVELHHWSYNPEHYKDIVEISISDHALVHRFLIYDQEYMKYRTKDNTLLETKEQHLEYLNKILSENKF